MTWVVEVPEPEPRSALPAGGLPADDRAYLAWRDDALSSAAERDLVARWHQSVDAPRPLDPWRFDAFLYAELGGPCPVFGARDVVTYNHRLRFLAIRLRTSRREVCRAAALFLGGAAL